LDKSCQPQVPSFTTNRTTFFKIVKNTQRQTRKNNILIIKREDNEIKNSFIIILIALAQVKPKDIPMPKVELPKRGRKGEGEH
jgi:hypothetical protein